MTERRLHIGGKQKRDGWEILDVNPGPLVDHLGNAIDLSQFADGTFAEIYASHVLEHFDYKEALVAALREWNRVLAPGGVLIYETFTQGNETVGKPSRPMPTTTTSSA